MFTQNNILFNIPHNTKGQGGILNVAMGIINYTGCDPLKMANNKSNPICNKLLCKLVIFKL